MVAELHSQQIGWMKRRVIVAKKVYFCYFDPIGWMKRRTIDGQPFCIMAPSCWKVTPWWLRSIQNTYNWDNLLLWVSFIRLLIAGAGAGCLARRQERTQTVIVTMGSIQREKYKSIFKNIAQSKEQWQWEKKYYHVFKNHFQKSLITKENFVQNKIESDSPVYLDLKKITDSLSDCLMPRINKSPVFISHPLSLSIF